MSPSNIFVIFTICVLNSHEGVGDMATPNNVSVHLPTAPTIPEQSTTSSEFPSVIDQTYDVSDVTNGTTTPW